MHYLLRPRPGGGDRNCGRQPAGAAATIATLPSWMRQLGGFDQPARRSTAPSRPRPARDALGTSPRLSQPVLRHTAPATARIRAQHLRDERPHPARTTTPAAVRAGA